MALLSHRETQVLALKCERGMTSRGVGDALGISHMTVKNHLTLIYHKLGVGCIAEACDRWARDDQQKARVSAMRAWDV